MSLATLDSLVRRLAPDKDRRLDVDAYAAAIEAAVLRYSADRPLDRVADLIVSGGAAALPAGWDSQHRVLSIEYPIGEFPPSELPATDYQIQQLPDGTAVTPVNVPEPDYAAAFEAAYQ